jgi:hypothetical protein
MQNGPRRALSEMRTSSFTGCGGRPAIAKNSGMRRSYWSLGSTNQPLRCISSGLICSSTRESLSPAFLMWKPTYATEVGRPPEPLGTLPRHSAPSGIVSTATMAMEQVYVRVTEPGSQLVVITTEPGPGGMDGK